MFFVCVIYVLWESVLATNGAWRGRVFEGMCSSVVGHEFLVVVFTCICCVYVL